MNKESFFKEKLSSVLFLEINSESISNIFHMKILNNIPIPIISNDIISGIKDGENFENIKVTYIVEAMYYLLGCDKNFKYAKEYKILLNSREETENYIKSIIAGYVKRDELVEAYIYLKGLFEVNTNEEYYNNLLAIGSCINNNIDFMDELYCMIDHGKSLNYNDAYLLEARLKKQQELYLESKLAYQEYFRNLSIKSDRLNSLFIDGNEENKSIICEIIKEITKEHDTNASEERFNFYKGVIIEYINVKNLENYETGKLKVYDAPKEALELLIPLLSIYKEDAELRYYIALSYRILQNPYKAIYYLNEAYSLDSALVNVFNELGINYSLLGDYKNAVTYFRKAFEATKSIEICTNLILCYINLGDKKEAKLHYDIAKKLSPNDEILIKIQKLLQEENHGVN